MNPEIFTPEIRTKADAIVARYASKRAGMLEVLKLLADHFGSITPEIEARAAEYLEVPAIDVREVVTFYTLLRQTPKAKRHFCVCRSLSCALRGGEEVLKYLEQKLGIKAGEKTADGKFSIETAECLGACEMAPMMQVDDKEYVGPLTKEKIDELMKQWKN